IARMSPFEAKPKSSHAAGAFSGRTMACQLAAGGGDGEIDGAASAVALGAGLAVTMGLGVGTSVAWATACCGANVAGATSEQAASRTAATASPAGPATLRCDRVGKPAMVPRGELGAANRGRTYARCR